MHMKRCPRDTFINFVSKRQNRKYESDCPRKSGFFRTSVVEPNNVVGTVVRVNGTARIGGAGRCETPARVSGDQ